MNKQSIPRKPAIAGAIAGLLAAAIGAWYVSMQPATPAQQVQAAQPAPQASAPAQVAAMSREQAVQKLMELPELKRWADRIEQRSGGKQHGALLEPDPRPRAVNGQPYYQLTFVENGEESAQAIASFLVSHANGDILVEDDISGELLSLDKWRLGLKD